MSGGHWAFADQNLKSVTPEQLAIILEALPDIFHDVDWVLSNDSTSAPHLFNKVVELGNKLFGSR